MIVSKKTVISSLAMMLMALSAQIYFTSSAPVPTCMYCHRADMTHIILTSFSYCQASNVCLQDRWMYIDYPCSSGWNLGANVDLLGTCTPSVTNCNSFVSTSTAAGQQVNYTETLALGEYCNITIDATNYVARVVFDDALTLGVDLNGYKVGEVHVVPLGEKQTITVYNGDTSGAITFTLAFSKAQLSLLLRNTYQILGATLAAVALLSQA